MCHTFHFTLVFAVFAALCSTRWTQAAPPSEEYKLVWSDEFDGTQLDETKWFYRHENQVRRDAINSRDGVSLDGNGHLLLTTFKRDGKYLTGFIATRYQFRYGYAECRVEMQKAPGHWSAFWMMPEQMKNFDEPNPGEGGVEMDIYEYLCRYPDTLKQNLHWNGYQQGKHQHIGKDQRWPGLGEGFHIIGMEWTPGECVFYVDGKETWRTSGAVSHVNSYILLTLEVGEWGGKMAEFEDQLPDSVKFDYVRVYQK
ncbi:MAG: glycoside hydrolase family 16 protein [Thermoguttaceae bacterium]|nr:glycoside hydrolase family 16 protein [Thermoguttaceae bacterium]